LAEMARLRGKSILLINLEVRRKRSRLHAIGSMIDEHEILP
jgi:hypothetical protein